jgi:mRNA-decapping enzyme subunit 2
LVEKNTPVHPLEVTMHDQQVRLYVFRGVPEDTVFETRTRKEIGDIKWYKVSDLPAYRKKKGTGRVQGPATASQDKFYMVAPFMVQLRQWVLKQKKLDAENAPAYAGHKHPPAFYDENLTDDNMLREPPPPTSSGTYPEDIDSATRELHRLLQIKPPTQGLQLPTPVSNPQAGQTLLSILQPKVMADTGYMSGQSHAQPHTPHDQEFATAPQPPTPHYDHLAQRMHFTDYSAPPSFPTESNAGLGPSYQTQYQQYRPRPQVFVSSEIPQPPHFQSPQHPPPNRPIQLLHPQPLPPQVQKAMLLRDLASSPNVTGAATQPAPPSIPQASHPAPLNGRHQHYSPQGNNSHLKYQPQLATHSANLLNVLKGKNLPTTSSHPSPLSGSVQTRVEDQRQEQRSPASGARFPSQYGAVNIPQNAISAATINAPVPFSGGSNRPPAPTDKHRASLLDMFKTGQSPVSRKPVDGQGASLPTVVSRASGTNSPKQQRARQGPSTADVLEAAAREDGKPIQFHPERNLPFGAHSILRRPSQSSARSPAHSTRNSSEAANHLPVRSHPSPASSRAQMSPRMRMSPYQSHLHARIQSPKQAVSQAQPYTGTQSYPYGGNRGSVPNPITQFQGTPPASTLPAPGTIKPRQNSTVEHRNALLSMFGKSQPDAEQDKGKEAMTPEQMGGPVPMPPSGLASFASQEPRRNSGTPLSPADRNFLLGFLENASNNAKG